MYYIGNTSDISDPGDIVTSHTGAWLCIQSILDNCDLLENVSIGEIVGICLFVCLFVFLCVIGAVAQGISFGLSTERTWLQMTCCCVRPWAG